MTYAVTLPPPPADPPPIRFLVPEGFFTLPLAGTAEERAERAQAFVRELYARGDETVWEPAAPHYSAPAETMQGTGVSYAAMGLFSTSDEPVTPEGELARHDLDDWAAQCAFTLAAVPTDQAVGDTDTVAQGILATLSSDPLHEVERLDLSGRSPSPIRPTGSTGSTGSTVTTTVRAARPTAAGERRTRNHLGTPGGGRRTRGRPGQ